jgi:hypothetical protein
MPDDAVISLGLIQRLDVVGCYSRLSVLYLGHPSNSDVTRVCVNDESLSWLRISKNRRSTEGLLYLVFGRRPALLESTRGLASPP